MYRPDRWGGSATSTFVLVHGAWHGAWCWEAVASHLSGRGHTVYCPDLPAHGANPKQPANISMQSYIDCIASTLDSVDEPAILVGHSFGGAVVSQTTELHPEAVGTAVYVCGFLLRDGQSVWRHGLPSPRSAVAAPAVLSAKNLIVDEEQGVLDVDRSVIAEGFYHDCSDLQRERAIDRWTPEPLAPLRTPLTLTERRFGSVPRAYVYCSADRVIPLAAQQRMCRLTPCERQTTLSCGHSAPLSAPEELARRLNRLAVT